MKKELYALIAIILLCSTTAFGQQKPFVFGFKAGPNMGWLKPDTKGYESTGVQPGFSWGFIADFYLMENYSITTGFDVVFLNGGLEMPDRMEVDANTFYEGTLNRKYKLKYIQVPVTFKMKTNELGKFKIFGQIGLGTNFLIGAKADDTFTASDYTTSEDDLDIYDEITFIRESLIIGGGVEFSLGGSTSLMASILFNNGFIDVLNGKNTVDPTLNNKANANYLSFEVGIVF